MSSNFTTRLTSSLSTLMPFAGIPGACGRCGRKNHAGLCPPKAKHHKRKKKVAPQQFEGRGVVVVGTGKIAASGDKTKRAKKVDRATKKVEKK